MVVECQAQPRLSGAQQPPSRQPRKQGLVTQGPTRQTGFLCHPRVCQWLPHLTLHKPRQRTKGHSSDTPARRRRASKRSRISPPPPPQLQPTILAITITAITTVVVAVAVVAAAAAAAAAVAVRMRRAGPRRRQWTRDSLSRHPRLRACAVDPRLPADQTM